MKILYITSLSGRRINRFMRSSIVAAKRLGFDFEMACNMDTAVLPKYLDDCKELGITPHHIPFRRNPLSPKNIKAYKELSYLIKTNHYDIVHCNTPIGGLLGRKCAKKHKISKVIYQAHGFHFWDGAPLKNWLFYYPVEKHLAKYTDLYLTINEEDYKRSLKFTLKKNGRCFLVHGVGIDKIQPIDESDKKRLLDELQIPNDSKVIMSVGELNDNKNHTIVLDALSKMTNNKFIYLICGEGQNRNKLQNNIQNKKLENNVKLLGFRSDVDKLLQISDLFVFPSLREGLPISLMEAIECSVPCSASRIRGVVDLLPNSELLFSPRNVEELICALEKINDKELIKSEINKNLANISKFEFENVVLEMMSIYKEAASQNE